MPLRFDNQTIIITGVSHGLGRLYATYFAECGANIVVHDQFNKSLVNDIVTEIKAAGGRAIAEHSPPDAGDSIIQSAIKHFGRIDVLINNASTTNSPAWDETRQDDWDSLLKANFKLSYKCVHAAWPHLKKQKYGRIISTSAMLDDDEFSDSPLSSAARLGQLGFIQTLAREGAKYNILACAIATFVAGSSTASISSTESEGLVLRSVAAIAHGSNSRETGHLYHVKGPKCRKLRWQRAAGAWLNPDAAMSAGSILNKWSDVNDFAKATYPTSSADFQAVLDKTTKLGHNAPGRDIRFDGKVILITGAGSGLGRAYALLFGSLGATVVLNDLNDPISVADEIKKSGGKAHTVIYSVSEGEKIVADTIQLCGRIDVIVNNAGFVRDKSIANMTDSLWDSIMEVHLNGMYKVTKAAWPHLVRQGYGRVVNISSTSGIYGNFGQSNYSLAKCAIVGFTQALARVGAQNNIIVNAVAPVASTPALALAVEGSSTAISPHYSAPFIALLCSDIVPHPSTGGLYEIGAGWHARTRLEANSGIDWHKPENIAKTLNLLASFQGFPVSYPGEDDDGLKLLTRQVHQRTALARIDSAKQARGEGSKFEYTQRDVILYNLTLGAKSKELPLVYENDKNFQVIPTFGAIPWFNAALPFTHQEILPNWDPLKFLHGEMYLEIRKYPIPTSGKLITYPRLLHVLDKKKAAVVTTAFTTCDMNTGEDIFYNESSIYVRDAGNFGGPAEAPGASTTTASIPSPSRRPDFEREERTFEEQAAFYRLNGDTNDLHIDPAVAVRTGFEQPILHGLCFFGISGKHIYQKYGPYKSIRARFAATVQPGQTLRTEAWRNPTENIVWFQTRVLETGKLCVAGGRVELLQASERSRL